MKTVIPFCGFLLIVVLACGLPQSAQAETGEPENVRLSHFPGALLDDVVALPSRENGWWLLGGSALTIVVYQFEDPESAASTLDQGVLDGLSDFGNIWGDVRVQAPLALGFWGIGSWAGSNEIAGLGFDMSRGLLLSYASVSLLKVIFNRTRPNGEDYSFPSGHAASAFTTAGVVSQRYGGWATGVAVGLGVFTAMGRMEDLKHYASDVVAGATIGWIIGRTVARDDPPDATAWQVVPFGRGLAVVKSF